MILVLHMVLLFKKLILINFLDLINCALRLILSLKASNKFCTFHHVKLMPPLRQRGRYWLATIPAESHWIPRIDNELIYAKG